MRRDILTWAKAEAETHLDLPAFAAGRWKHVRAVGARAERLATAFGHEAKLLAGAAWLHDIGYSPPLVRTGFHHLDGAAALKERGLDERVCGLVANHSAGALEAPMRGLADELANFPDEGPTPVRDALWTCDMTTSPVGQPIDFEDRLADILDRYGPEHSVARSITAGADEIRAAIQRTRERVRDAGLEVDF